MYFETPKISPPAASPENSAIVFPRSASSRPSIAHAIARTPNRSRIRSARPLPVTAPNREAISWITYSAMVIGIIVHSSV